MAQAHPRGPNRYLLSSSLHFSDTDLSQNAVVCVSSSRNFHPHKLDALVMMYRKYRPKWSCVLFACVSEADDNLRVVPLQVFFLSVVLCRNEGVLERSVLH